MYLPDLTVDLVRWVVVPRVTAEEAQLPADDVARERNPDGRPDVSAVELIE